MADAGGRGGGQDEGRSEGRNGEEGSEERGQSPWLWAIPLGFVAAVGLTYLLLPPVRSFLNEMFSVLTSGDIDRIRSWVQGFGPWAWGVMGALLLLQPFLLVAPSAGLMIVAVIAFGPLKGGLLAWGGMTASAILGYAIGRAFGPVTVDRLIGHKTERKLEDYVARYGAWVVALFRVSPVLSTDAISVVSGLVSMSFVKYLIATAAGLAPLALAIALMGESFDQLGRLLLWGSVASVALLVAWVAWDHRQRAKEGAG